ncbi:hypothetical protein CHLRE_02g078650v5 [Chlamydomonas reinhardtii]|uniref:Peptidase M20 dimerisation domain-containing protein n=1 Tax=Chlamydomonas reinhardtii TaxID=3055 RepID=A0A2K3E0G3_CHLRE|nr:uncharacterized protein CHLRE_02g078650v5 [Chlamydomonas reinhardtii]PNW86247.1 hypothetical protein CHLRE_02g078650v5 [Chlamydomonas reinhardtii]
MGVQPKLSKCLLALSTLALLACLPQAQSFDQSAPLQSVLKRLERQSDRYDADLTDLVAFPSVSALPDHLPHLLAAADWLVERLRQAGLQNMEILPTEGPHPVVYAEWLSAPRAANGTAAPTVLIYGHYDVQPVDPLELWDTPPFQVVKRDGYYYGRGVDDDKGGLLEALQAVEAWLQETGTLPVNVKFLLEGQEEVMSPHLTPFLRRHAGRLAADLALSADGGQPAADRGGLSLGLRGVVGAQLEVVTAGTDMHSGMKGGAVANPNAVLAALLAGMHDPATHAITVQGFYDDVLPVTDQDRRDVEAYGFDAEQEMSDLGLYGHVGEQGYSVLEQRWHRPTLEVVGMSGGFTGEGIKTVIPARASAKISCRLVPKQTPADILDKLQKHVAAHCPAYARCSLSALGGGAFPWTNPRDSPALAAAAEVHEALSGRPPLFLRDGATIPALAAFQQELKVDTTKFGWGLSDKIHAPNERLLAEMYDKGRRAWAIILERLAVAHGTFDEAAFGTAGSAAGKGAHDEL